MWVVFATCTEPKNFKLQPSSLFFLSLVSLLGVSSLYIGKKLCLLP